MGRPVPFRVQIQGASDDGPRGAIPIALYGAASGGGGGPIAIADVTGLTVALGDKVETSVFSSYQSQATSAFEELESAVETNTSNLSTTTSTANSAVQPNNVRLPIVIPQDVYDALDQAGTLIPDQLYFTTAPEA